MYTKGQWDVINAMREELATTWYEPDDSIAAKDQDPRVTVALMCLLLELVQQDTSRIPLYESPIMHYLAVRGIDVESQSLRSSFDYTPVLAAMLWMNRLLMLEVAVPSEAWPALRLKSRQEVESVPERVFDIRTKHLCEGSFSPTASILTQLAMGKSYNKKHQSPANIHWSDDEQTIFYLGKGIRLAKIRTMWQVLGQELRELVRLLSFDTELLTIDLDRIVDSML